MVARYAHANGEHIDAAMDNLEQRVTLPIRSDYTKITHGIDRRLLSEE